MAIGGVFGVMNTMFAAISQRTKDIGVLRILGFARWQILVSFLLESLVICLGRRAAGLCPRLSGRRLDGHQHRQRRAGGRRKFVVLELVIGADTLLTGMLLALAMGALGGLLPAISAMRLKPLESLR